MPQEEKEIAAPYAGKGTAEAARQAQAELFIDIRNDPYNFVMRTVFSRWKPFILHAMEFDEGKMTHFSRFTRQLPITHKVLSENLRQLEDDGLICRTIIPTKPPRVEYRLTEAGKSIIPILDDVYEWGWREMRRRGIPIDSIGEMWHGFRERDKKLMRHPYKDGKLRHGKS